MKTLEALFQVTTPMFLGDANQAIQEPSSLRPPSIKGALRFWWRALQWKNMLAGAGGVQATALRELHKHEAGLFGTAADEGGQGGQGKFLLSVAPDTTLPELRFQNPSAGHQYLLGQGLYHFKEGLVRKPLLLGGFSLKLVFRPRALDKELCSVAEAILLWGLLGGLGSRSRRGFGSVAIQELKGCDALAVPQNPSELREILQGLLQPLPEGLPPFTAFSEHSRIDISLKGNDPVGLLSRTGEEMQFYRSNGRGGKVRGRPAEPTFRSDHDLAQQAASGRTVSSHPRRVVFGLPHNYYFSGTGAQLDVNGSGGKERDRRASPLLTHVHRFPNKECAVIQSLLPAQFLPDTDRIQLEGGKHRQLVAQDVDWNVLRDFLNRFKGREVIYE